MSDSRHFDLEEAIEQLDKGNTLGSIEMLGDQIQHVWSLAQELQLDTSYRDVDKVVVCGMGGSALGTHVIQTVFKDELTVPVIIAPDYTVPNFVNKHTLVVASSYSGTTEETLSAVKDAQQKGAKITGITSGGALAAFFRQNQYPALIFEPTYNPSNSPRMALGYSIFGQIALFIQTGLLTINQQDYQNVLNTIAQVQLQCSQHVDRDNNPAKILAYQMRGRVPVITVAEHLEGIAHVIANQINENAKNYSEYRVIPELNHHLMEGLRYPETNEQNLFFLTVHSDLYLKSNQKRMSLTEEVLQKQQIEYLLHKTTGQSKLAQAFELLLFGSYAAFYLAMLNNLDPTPIPWVDWFKAQLK